MHMHIIFFFHKCFICHCRFPGHDDVYCFIIALLIQGNKLLRRELTRDFLQILGSQMFPKDLFFLR